MGEANTHFIMREFDKSEEQLKEILRQCPEYVDAYETLYFILDERGDLQRALDVRLLAAQIKRKDLDLWVECYTRARHLGRLKQAIIILGRMIKLQRDPKEIVDLKLRRVEIYEALKQYYNASKNLEDLIENHENEISEENLVHLKLRLAKQYELKGSPSDAFYVL